MKAELDEVREVDPCNGFDGLNPIVIEVQVLEAGELDALKGGELQLLLMA